MANYLKSKIYKLESEECDQIYIGSTIQTLSERISGHRCNYRRWLIGKEYYCSSYDLFLKYDVDTFKITLIENYPCKTKEQLRVRENYWINKFDNCVNDRNAFISEKDKKKKQKEYLKKYYQENREKLKKNASNNYYKSKKLKE